MPVLVQISNVIARVTKDCIFPIDNEKVIKISKKELFLMSVINLKFWVAENKTPQLPLLALPMPGREHKENRFVKKIDETKVNSMLICKAIIEDIVKGITDNSVSNRRKESINNNVEGKRNASKTVPRKRSLQNQKLKVNSNQTTSLKRRKIVCDQNSICLDLVKDIV